MTGFGSFDNSTCERVLDLLEPGDLRLGQVVKAVMVALNNLTNKYNLKTLSQFSHCFTVGLKRKLRLMFHKIIFPNLFKSSTVHRLSRRPFFGGISFCL